MTSCCPRRRMRWSGATGAIARCKNRSTGYARRDRSVPAWRWICGVKPTPKAVNKPLHHFIVHGLAKPGSSATVSNNFIFISEILEYIFYVVNQMPPAFIGIEFDPLILHKTPQYLTFHRITWWRPSPLSESLLR